VVRRTQQRPLEDSALRLACHKVDDWIRDMKGSRLIANQTYFRCLVQVLIERSFGPGITGQLSQVPMSRYGSWEEYFSAAQSRITPPLTPAPSVADIALLNSEHAHWRHRFVVLLSLRGLIGPVIESLVLMDRALWMLETAPCHLLLFPLFAPDISPRNFVRCRF
jgi:hypothetical protein